MEKWPPCWVGLWGYWGTERVAGAKQMCSAYFCWETPSFCALYLWVGWCSLPLNSLQRRNAEGVLLLQGKYWSMNLELRGNNLLSGTLMLLRSFLCDHTQGYYHIWTVIIIIVLTWFVFFFPRRLSSVAYDLSMRENSQLLCFVDHFILPPLPPQYERGCLSFYIFVK